MAELRKYLDTTALGTLVDEIKKADAATLASSKSYADGLAKNYDASGSAATAEANAKAYTDALANGTVATNTAAIAKLNGAATEEGSVAKAVKDAQDALQAGIDTVSGVANQNKSDIETLAGYVGTIPEGATATDIVGYVQEKTEGIATDAALSELQNAVDAVEGDVATIKGDYLKGDDKTELSDAIAAEATTARAAEKVNADAIKAIQDDYLVEADKTELQGNIDTVGGKVTTLIGDDANKSVRTIANEELAKQLIAEGAAESLDTLAEIAAWIQEHPEDASAMNKAIEDLEALVGTIPEGVTATTIVGYIAEVQAAVDAEKARAEGAESDLADRIDALEDAIGESGSVADDIATAKQEAIDTAAGDATTKANTAETNAKGYADGLNTAMNTRVEALEAIDHDHANKAELDLIASGDKAKWDAAAGNAHTHDNKDVLDAITAAQVAAWDAAEQAAKTYADGLNTAMQATVDGVAGRVSTLEKTITEKADADDLDAAVERIAANETAIATNTSAINSFTAITSDEVTAMFA